MRGILTEEEIKLRTSSITKAQLLTAGIVDTYFVQPGANDSIEGINKEDYRIFTIKSDGEVLGDVYTKIRLDDKGIISVFNDEELLGVVLGYPPLCCHEFVKLVNFPLAQIHKMPIIDYNGISFNTAGHLIYALEWCKKKYEQKILDKFNKSDYVILLRDLDKVIRCIKTPNSYTVTINGDLIEIKNEKDLIPMLKRMGYRE